jgi:hypothetical protein
MVTASATATTTATPPCCLRPTTFAAVSSTETSHRIGHVIAPAILTSSFYGFATYAGAKPRDARLIAIGLSAVAILVKEVYDYNTEARRFSGSDIALGAAGTAIGMVIAEKITWPEEKKKLR